MPSFIVSLGLEVAECRNLGFYDEVFLSASILACKRLHGGNLAAVVTLSTCSKLKINSQSKGKNSPHFTIAIRDEHHPSPSSLSQLCKWTLSLSLIVQMDSVFLSDCANGLSFSLRSYK
jgi:hypothetical protein